MKKIANRVNATVASVLGLTQAKTTRITAFRPCWAPELRVLVHL